ncbi:hypothetical protein P171DRAFT_242498 [Karstenula rhodostoma CBS 690.94]|uniref:Uncharacterized protein n=1 Tax=Karstenula rhodostoma CBS 690.94 TaxID=1392251 RepID=A0A9P4PN26_9PLEO|nr:hypothetical protein P171DRAFT_242498 [Karstenula rhodostoma CBS 690.94]
MPPKAVPLQKNKIINYFSTPSQRSQNAAFASSPAAPSTIQETPTADATTTLHDGALNQTAPSSLSSPLVSRSPSPTAPRGIATYDGTAEHGMPTLPQSSGNSTNASKRTFSGGIPVVLNSDSDTDSLTDLEDLLDYQPAKPKAVTRAATVWTRKDPKALALPQPPKRKNDDQAFKRLVQAARRNAQMEREIAEAQAELDRPLRQEPTRRGLEISEKMVADAVHGEDDPDKAKRLYLAMQRTNAFQVDCAFHFFNQEPDGLEKPFPIESINPQITPTFQDESSRNQAFLTGFARLLFSRELPEELADWMIDEVCIGASEALGKIYLEILSTNQLHLRKLLDVARLEEIFNKLGAVKQYTTSDSEVAVSYGSDPGKHDMLPPALVNVCKLLQLPGSLLRAEARRRALKILFVICMDNGVQRVSAVLHAVQDAIESLICPIPSTGEIASILDDIISHLLVRVRHPILQRNLVTALPTRYPLTASIQRHLALSFLLHPTKITHPLTSHETLNSIHDHLEKSPTFRVKKNTDYTILAAHFMLLDIAIGPGPLTVPFQLITSPSASQESQGQSPVEPPKPTSDEVKAFNREVDALAQQIRLIGNRINVAGAITDLSRLTASDACDRLCVRLEHVVRIGGRKMNRVFGGEEDNQDNKATFAKFFAKKKQGPLRLGGTSAGKGTKREVVVASGVGEGTAAEECSGAGILITLKPE